MDNDIKIIFNDARLQKSLENIITLCEQSKIKYPLTVELRKLSKSSQFQYDFLQLLKHKRKDLDDFLKKIHDYDEDFISFLTFNLSPQLFTENLIETVRVLAAAIIGHTPAKVSYSFINDQSDVIKNNDREIDKLKVHIYEKQGFPYWKDFANFYAALPCSLPANPIQIPAHLLPTDNKKFTDDVAKLYQKIISFLSEQKTQASGYDIDILYEMLFDTVRFGATNMTPQVVALANKNGIATKDLLMKQLNHMPLLYYAVRAGNIAVVEYICQLCKENEIKVDDCSCFNITPLYLASFLNKRPLIEILVKYEADICAKNGEKQETSLHAAVESGGRYAISALLSFYIEKGILLEQHEQQNDIANAKEIMHKIQNESEKNLKTNYKRTASQKAFFWSQSIPKRLNKVLKNKAGVEIVNEMCSNSEHQQEIIEWFASTVLEVFQSTYNDAGSKEVNQLKEMIKTAYPTLNSNNYFQSKVIVLMNSSNIPNGMFNTEQDKQDYLNELKQPINLETRIEQLN